MTDRDVGEVVSEALFPVVLPDFTSQTRSHIEPVAVHLWRIQMSQRGRRRRQRSGRDPVPCRRLRVSVGGERGENGVTPPGGAAAWSAPARLKPGGYVCGLLQRPAPTLGASFIRPLSGSGLEAAGESEHASCPPPHRPHK